MPYRNPEDVRVVPVFVSVSHVMYFEILYSKKKNNVHEEDARDEAVTSL